MTTIGQVAGASKTIEVSAQCSGAGGDATITAYAMAVANPASLPTFVKENAKLFGENGKAIKCFRLLTAKLMKTGAQYNTSDDKRHQVLSEFEKTDNLLFDKMRADFFGRNMFHAEFMKNLVETLPLAAKGDDLGYVRSNFFFEMIFLNHAWYAALGSDPENELRDKLKNFAEQFIQKLMLYSSK